MQTPKLLAVFILVFASSSYVHSTVSHGSGGNTYITAIDLGWGTKRVNVTLSNPVEIDANVLSCGYGGSQIQADESQDNIDQVLSVALAAYLSSKPVRVAVSEAECSLGGRYKMLAIGM